MNIRTNPLTAPIEHSTHQLTGKALRQWWQVDAFIQIKSKPDTMYTNHAIRAMLGFLAIIPFYAMLGISSMHLQGTAQTIFFIRLLLTWIISFAVLMPFIRHHLNVIMKARLTEEGLELQSLWFKQKLHWWEIADFFQTGNDTVGYNEWLLDCTNGDQLILSKDLTDSDKLFEEISRRISAPAQSYQSSYRIGDGFFDMAAMLAFAVLLAVTYGPVMWLTTRPVVTAGALVANLVVPALLATTALLFWWLHKTKIPQLIRSGSSGILLRTRSGVQSIAWNQITKIANVGPWMIIKSRSNWFIAFAEKKAPVFQKLVAEKKNLLP